MRSILLSYIELTVLSSLADGLLYKGVGKEESVYDDETEASEGVETEAECRECGQYGQQDK